MEEKGIVPLRTPHKPLHRLYDVISGRQTPRILAIIRKKEDIGGLVAPIA